MHRERHGRGWQNDGIFPFKLTRGTPTAQILSPLARVVPLPISTITKTRRIRAAMRRGPRAFTGTTYKLANPIIRIHTVGTSKYRRYRRYRGTRYHGTVGTSKYRGTMVPGTG